MPGRNRAILLLLMPVAVFLWCVGWGIYWFGSKRNGSVPRKLLGEKDLTFVVPVPEQKVTV